jgi:hypothetical protein
MCRFDLGITALRGELLSALHGFLGFDGQFVETEWHLSFVQLTFVSSQLQAVPATDN